MNSLLTLNVKDSLNLWGFFPQIFLIFFSPFSLIYKTLQGNLLQNYQWFFLWLYRSAISCFYIATYLLNCFNVVSKILFLTSCFCWLAYIINDLCSCYLEDHLVYNSGYHNSTLLWCEKLICTKDVFSSSDIPSVLWYII